MKELRCPNCDAPLTGIQRGIKSTICEYCGAGIILDELNPSAIDRKSERANREEIRDAVRKEIREAARENGSMAGEDEDYQAFLAAKQKYEKKRARWKIWKKIWGWSLLILFLTAFLMQFFGIAGTSAKDNILVDIFTYDLLFGGVFIFFSKPKQKLRIE